MKITKTNLAKFTDDEAAYIMQGCLDLLRHKLTGLQQEVVRQAIGGFFTLIDYRYPILIELERVCIEVGQPVFSRLHNNDSYKRYLGLEFREEHPLRRFDRGQMFLKLMDASGLDLKRMYIGTCPDEADILPLRARVAEAERVKQKRKRDRKRADLDQVQVETAVEVRPNPVGDKYKLKRAERELKQVRIDKSMEQTELKRAQSEAKRLKQENIELRKLLGRTYYWGESHQTQFRNWRLDNPAALLPTKRTRSVALDTDMVIAIAEHGAEVPPTQAWNENPKPVTKSVPQPNPDFVIDFGIVTPGVTHTYH